MQMASEEPPFFEGLPFMAVLIAGFCGLRQEERSLSMARIQRPFRDSGVCHAGASTRNRGSLNETN
jgi:hypothetical protein